ncbi:hypothetical protein [Micromonospora sp. NPDC003816]|uniref:hypothetical protein n=1 Tax=Micromonospora sp. NPDC003816 TaxID=3364224 RepID=UPI0036C077A8
MTSMYDEPPQADVEQLAAVVVARHRDRRHCPSCTTDGCRELDWAEPITDAAEARWLEAARG